MEDLKKEAPCPRRILNQVKFFFLTATKMSEQHFQRIRECPSAAVSRMDGVSDGYDRRCSETGLFKNMQQCPLKSMNAGFKQEKILRLVEFRVYSEQTKLRAEQRGGGRRAGQPGWDRLRTTRRSSGWGDRGGAMGGVQHPSKGSYSWRWGVTTLTRRGSGSGAKLLWMVAPAEDPAADAADILISEKKDRFLSVELLSSYPASRWITDSNVRVRR